MTRCFWIEGKVCDVEGTEDETNGIDLLGLETKVLWDETKDRKF